MIRSFSPSPRGPTSASPSVATSPWPALPATPAAAPAPAGHDLARISVSSGGTAPIQRVVEQKANGKWHDSDYPEHEFDSQAEAARHSANQIRLQTPHASTSLDVPSLLRTSMADVDLMAQQVPSATDFPHLNRTHQDTGRRGALIQAPEDRARLAQQARQQGGFYSQLYRPGGDAPVGTGRMQSPRFNPTESHVYGPHGEFAPYPTASQEVSAMARGHGVPTQQVFGDLLLTLQGQPPVTPLSQEQQGQLHNTANILGIAEAHRDPFMSAMSTAELSNASHEPTATPTQVFGTKQGKINRQGRLAASGTDAKRAMAIARDVIQDGTDVDEAGPRVIRELEKKRKKPSAPSKVREYTDNARQRLANMDETTRTHLQRTARVESEKATRGVRPFEGDPGLERESLMLRLRSSLRRDQMTPTGLLAKRLRPLSGPAVGKGPGWPASSLATDEEVNDWFADAQHRDEEEEDETGVDVPDEHEPLNKRFRPNGPDDEDPGSGAMGGAQLVS